MFPIPNQMVHLKSDLEAKHTAFMLLFLKIFFISDKSSRKCVCFSVWLMFLLSFHCHFSQQSLKSLLTVSQHALSSYYQQSILHQNVGA